MNVNQQKRPTLRQRQAQATREAIAVAARTLFLENGYTSSTIQAIADRAGVAGSTVYAVFGSKRGILRAVRESWQGRSQIRELVEDISPVRDPAQYLDRLAGASRQQWQSGAEVIAIYTAASAADPEAANELAEALAGRRKALAALARNLEPHLKAGLSVAHAAAILQALCLPQLYDELVGESGWSPEAYQAWLSEALQRELLG